jgi:hypothetical protein
VVWKERAGWAGVAAVNRFEDDDEEVVEDTAVEDVNGLAAVAFDLVIACPAMAPVSTSMPATLAAPAVRRAFRAGCGLDRRVVVMTTTIGVEPQETLGIT